MDKSNKFEKDEQFNDYVSDNYEHLRDSFISDIDNENIFKEYLLENIYGNSEYTNINEPRFNTWYEETLNNTKIEYPFIVYANRIDNTNNSMNTYTHIYKTKFETLFNILLDRYLINNESMFIDWVEKNIN